MRLYVCVLSLCVCAWASGGGAPGPGSSSTNRNRPAQQVSPDLRIKGLESRIAGLNQDFSKCQSSLKDAEDEAAYWKKKHSDDMKRAELSKGLAVQSLQEKVEELKRKNEKEVKHPRKKMEDQPADHKVELENARKKMRDLAADHKVELENARKKMLDLAADYSKEQLRLIALVKDLQTRLTDAEKQLPALKKLEEYYTLHPSVSFNTALNDAKMSKSWDRNTVEALSKEETISLVRIFDPVHFQQQYRSVPAVPSHVSNGARIGLYEHLEVTNGDFPTDMLKKTQLDNHLAIEKFSGPYASSQVYFLFSNHTFPRDGSCPTFGEFARGIIYYGESSDPTARFDEHNRKFLTEQKAVAAKTKDAKYSDVQQLYADSMAKGGVIRQWVFPYRTYRTGSLLFESSLLKCMPAKKSDEAERRWLGNQNNGFVELVWTPEQREAGGCYWVLMAYKSWASTYSTRPLSVSEKAASEASSSKSRSRRTLESDSGANVQPTLVVSEEHSDSSNSSTISFPPTSSNQWALIAGVTCLFALYSAALVSCTKKWTQGRGHHVTEDALPLRRRTHHHNSNGRRLLQNGSINRS